MSITLPRSSEHPLSQKGVVLPSKPAVARKASRVTQRASRARFPGLTSSHPSETTCAMSVLRTVGAFLLLAALCSVAREIGTAETVPTNKCRYTLFNPTPRKQMREMATDRPDKTESPYTVDAGHVQI